MKFAELLRYGEFADRGVKGPGDAQQWARRHFPLVVREHGLKLLDTSRPWPPVSGRHVMIGVAAAYSGADLEILDEVGGALSKQTDEEIELLDISGPGYPPALDALIRRGAGQTPIVAIWDAGRLVRTEFGKSARDFLRSRYLGNS
ncbi:MAG TPA: hypothetical protein VFY93_07755 [Planctomycetota bacterium]|nr:hypothetical protein [Planctomycetota bacterium]